MVIVKEMYIEAKRSRNFQTYTSGVLLTLEGEEQTSEAAQDIIRREWQAKCRRAVMEQIKVDAGK